MLPTSCKPSSSAEARPRALASSHLQSGEKCVSTEQQMVLVVVGVETSVEAAARLYALAAAQGLACAQFDLGMCLEFRQGVERDMAEAIRLYTAAAAHARGAGSDRKRRRRALARRAHRPHRPLARVSRRRRRRRLRRRQRRRRRPRAGRARGVAVLLVPVWGYSHK
jgi:hypothetical protein